MARVIHLPFARHEEVQRLLPWYVNGQLDRADALKVEAHIARCAKCRAELRFERRLDAEVAGLPLEVERGWAQLRPQLQAGGSDRLTTAAKQLWRRAASPVGVGWLLAAQFVVILMAGALLLTRPEPASYRALGSPLAQKAGDAIVIFRPETRERDMRQTLRAAGARLVDGPTAADAYVLNVPTAKRASSLAWLRAQPDVLLAEPIDAGAAP